MASPPQQVRSGRGECAVVCGHWHPPRAGHQRPAGEESRRSARLLRRAAPGRGALPFSLSSAVATGSSTASAASFFSFAASSFAAAASAAPAAAASAAGAGAPTSLSVAPARTLAAEQEAMLLESLEPAEVGQPRGMLRGVREALCEPVVRPGIWEPGPKPSECPVLVLDGLLAGFDRLPDECAKGPM